MKSNGIKADIIEKVKKGNKEAQEIYCLIIKDNAEKTIDLYSTVYDIQLSKDDIDDMVQDTILYVIEHIPTMMYFEHVVNYIRQRFMELQYETEQARCLDDIYRKISLNIKFNK